MRVPVIVGLAIALALLLVFGIAGVAGHSGGTPQPADRYRASQDCGGCA